MLCDAILDYGEFGTEPELEGMVGVAWDFLRPKLDRDNDRYERQTEQRRYAVYVREAKGQGGPILSLKEWKDRLSSGEDRAVSDDIGRYPNPKQQPTNLKLQTPYPIPIICHCQAYNSRNYCCNQTNFSLRLKVYCCC